MENLGALAVAIPGSLKGYSAIYKSYGGGVSWASLFEPTIKYCEQGMEISEHLWSVLKTAEELIKNDAMLRYNTINCMSVFVVRIVCS